MTPGDRLTAEQDHADNYGRSYAIVQAADLALLLAVADAARGYGVHLEADNRSHPDGDGCWDTLEATLAALDAEGGRE